MASLYKNTSIAEQNSLDISWSALMSDRFKELRHFIFNSKEDLIRFRQIIVNVGTYFFKTTDDMKTNLLVYVSTHICFEFPDNF